MLTNRGGWSGIKMHNAETRLYLDNWIETRRISTSKNIALDSGTRQCGCKRTHVYVHSAAIIQAGLSKRRGVETKDR